ncbi:hypothetical protein LCGC14_0901070 [marine sediment metagenome]|uniref:Uncharacterized protein n=1 Tax=marine sediment metagenome TaxID=412755 RepID=A0A0F9S3C9_9ZZZZ
MAFEFVIFLPAQLVSHQKLSQLAENDDFFTGAWGSYKRPKLKFVNGNVVTVEENNGVALQSKIFDEAGDVFISIGSDTSDERGCDLTKTLDFSSATPQGGLHSDFTLTDNSWYFIYAVLTSDPSQSGKFVLGASETAPLRGNAGTLNTEFGLFGYEYLGAIRYGDSVSAPSAILDFEMAGGMTMFKNTVTGNSGRASVGIQLATGASTNNLIYTYASGRGDLQIPLTLDNALYLPSFEDSVDSIFIRNSATTMEIARSVGGYNQIFDIPADFGMQAQTLAAKGVDIFLAGFHDSFFQPDHNKLYW